MSSKYDAQALEQMGERIQSRLKQSRDYFDEHKSRWDDIEDRLFGEIKSVAKQLDEWEEFHTGMQQRQINLRKEKQSLEERRVELDARCVTLDEQQLEIDSKRRQVERDLEQRRQEIESGAISDEQQAQIDQLQAELDELRSQAETAANESTELDAKIAEQEKSQEQLKAQYKAARDALLASRDAGKDLQAKLSHAQSMLEKKTAQVNEMDNEFQIKEEELRSQLAEMESRTQAALSEAEEARALADQSAMGQSAGVDSAHVERLEIERDDLINQLSELKRELYSGGGGGGDSELAGQLEQLTMALEEAQQRNEQLASQLASGATSSEDGGSPIKPGMSWEEQKAALLGQTSEMSPLDRLTVDKAVQVTENAVAERDAEIAELRRQLATAGGPVDSGVAAPAGAPPIADVQSTQEAERQAEIRKALQRAEAARAARDAEDAMHSSQPQRPRQTRSLRDEMGL